MLNDAIKVPMPTEKVQVLSRQGRPYVYKVIRTYRNKKGRPTCDRTMIGRLDEQSGMLIPNKRYYELYGAPDAPGAAPEELGAVMSAGVPFALGAVLSSLGATSLLVDALGEARAGRVATVAAYMLSCGNVMDHLADFCEGALVPVRMDGRAASALFSSIAQPQRMSFFGPWARRLAARECIAYDVTSLSTYSEGVEDAEWGHNRDGERLPQVNMAMYVGQDSGLPVFYCTYPGSVVDKSHLPSMMAFNADLGVEGVTFVMDRGFASTANLRFMHERGYPYVLGIETFRKAVRGAVDESMAELASMGSLIADGGVHGVSRRGTYYGVRSTLHVFFDGRRRARAEMDLMRRVEADEERLAQLAQLTDREAGRYRRRGFSIETGGDGSFSFGRDWAAIEQMARYMGYFCIITSADMGAGEALGIYRRRDVVEKTFDEVKNHLDMDRLRTHGAATAEGKMFCAFVALVARMGMEQRLGEWMRREGMNMERVIRELGKIRCASMASGRRLMCPLTRRQREIIEGIGSSEDAVRAYVESWGKLLV